MQRRIGIIPDRCARPLFSRFREPEFGIVSGTPGELSVKLRGRQLDGAFLSPVDAVRHPGTLRPAGSAALVSQSAAGTARLLFREGARTIESIAADPGRTSEIVLAHLVLVEKYGSVPRIIPRSTPIGDLPDSLDALLLTGDEAGRLGPSDPWIDLVDDWLDITGLPFVHGLWYTTGDALAGREEELFGPPDAAAVETGAREGDEPGGGEARPSGSITYELGENERSGLIEFVRMAYYHGILKDIPETDSIFAAGPRNTKPGG